MSLKLPVDMFQTTRYIIFLEPRLLFSLFPAQGTLPHPNISQPSMTSAGKIQIAPELWTEPISVRALLCSDLLHTGFNIEGEFYTQAKERLFEDTENTDIYILRYVQENQSGQYANEFPLLQLPSESELHLAMHP